MGIWMHDFEWFKALPSINDPLPTHVTLQEDTDDDEAAEYPSEQVNLSDLFIQIDYVNAKGISSRRTITIRKAVKSGESLGIYAWCHTSNKLKRFRLDRITSIVTTDGEIFEPPSDFWKSVGFDEVKAAPVADVKPINRLTVASLNDRFSNQLVLLAALSKSDGSMHKKELDEIIQFVERELEWDGIELDASEIEALRNYVKRMRITRERLEETMDDLLKCNRKLNQSAKQRLRFFNASRNLVNADGLLHEAELEFLDYLQSRLDE